MGCDLPLLIVATAAPTGVDVLRSATWMVRSCAYASPLGGRWLHLRWGGWWFMLLSLRLQVATSSSISRPHVRRHLHGRALRFALEEDPVTERVV